MKYLRNADVKRMVFLLLLLTCISTAAICLLSPWAGVIAFITSLITILLLLLFTRRRYRQIEQLNTYLKMINSGQYSLDVRDNTEGELSILKNEIYKVTVMLHEQNEKLVQEKISLSDALSDISHQLKTPLTSMLVMTDLLCDTDLPEEKRKEFTDSIRVQLERIQWLVSSLLKLSKLDVKAVKFNSRNVRMSDIIRLACAPLLIPIELKNQTLDIRDNNISLRCDENWTVEALVNILKNCVEYTPEYGEIRIICVENPLYKQIIIEDSGPGINRKDLPHIFERFYRGANAANDSIGIGLAMAAAIIQEQGGFIQADTGNTGGSIFTLRFPK